MAEIVKVPNDDGRYLVCSRFREQFHPGWFSPEYWGSAISPVSSGGRGGAWFVDAPDQPWVLRHYLRGGLVSRILSNHYLYTGTPRVRSFRELELLEQLFAEGLPVPEPVAAAFFTGRGLFYSCAIVIKRLPDTTPMGDLWATLPLSRWREVGAVIRKFHDRNVFHADLNCFNILLSDDSVYLIDFDKGQRFEDSAPDVPWKRANLERLKRSLLKVCNGSSESLAPGWSALLDGYRHTNAPAIE